MEDISDPPFRVICREMGADLVYSEFISSEGLIRNADKSTVKLDIFEGERPIAIQVFGHDEESMKEAAGIIERANPDIIDINFGCPVKKVVKMGAGAGALQDLTKMIKITESIVKSTDKPVTVKTRLGWNSENIHIVELCERLQDAGVQAVALHARTAVQMYSGNADWSWFIKVKENPRFHIPLFGNGDVRNAQDAKKMIEEYAVDGVMIGRAAIGNPWIFRETRSYLQKGEISKPPSIQQRAQICKKHLLGSVKWKGERLGILEMRKHYRAYFAGIQGIKTYRQKLVESNEITMLLDILDDLQRCFSG